jgi:hypothetical protein
MHKRRKQMEEAHVTVIPYTIEKLNKVKGWDGLISPDGHFYKVCKRDTLVAAHDYFAEIFVSFKYNEDINEKYKKFQKIKSRYDNIRLAPKDILINLYGFVNYEHINNGYVEITPPEKEYLGFQLTNAQFNTIAELIVINQDKSESVIKMYEKYYGFTMENKEEKTLFLDKSFKII